MAPIEVIELSDSDSPEPPRAPPPRRLKSKTRNAPAGPSKARRAAPIEVIELTDSDSEPPEPKPTLHHKERNRDFHRAAALHASTPVPNVPDPVSPRIHKAPTHIPEPLFLPSDEENAPPAPDYDLFAFDYPPFPVAPELEGFGAIEDIFDAFLHDIPHDQAPPLLPPEAEERIPPPPAPPHDEPVVDLVTSTVTQVLEIVPDVDPSHILSLAETHVPTRGTQCTEYILHLLLEDPTYPKAQLNKGKKRQSSAAPSDSQQSPKRVKIDFRSVDRPYPSGPNYFEAALRQLELDFPTIPVAYIRHMLSQNGKLYTPTYWAIADGEKIHAANPAAPIQYSPLAHARSSKGKHRLIEDPDLSEERKLVLSELEELAVECQCCFSDYPFSRMIQCPNEHSFCFDCARQYSATKLGDRDAALNCIHSSGCVLPFHRSELERILSDKLLSLYDRIKQDEEIKAAGLDMLEECPFCDWKVEMEASVDEDKLFRCRNWDGGCGVVSCRLCKKKDHLPKTCEEAAKDRVLDGQHAIEEAMTQALMRNCPKCKKAFIKESGCNKMVCPTCKQMSCYVCRQAISGYEHFHQNTPGRGASSSNKKCLLHDDVESRHAEEVREAATKAMAEYKEDNPGIEDSEIKIDIPEAPAPPKPNPLPAPWVPARPPRRAGRGRAAFPVGFEVAVPPVGLRVRLPPAARHAPPPPAPPPPRALPQPPRNIHHHAWNAHRGGFQQQQPQPLRPPPTAHRLLPPPPLPRVQGPPADVHVPATLQPPFLPNHAPAIPMNPWLPPGHPLHPARDPPRLEYHVNLNLALGDAPHRHLPNPLLQRPAHPPPPQRQPQPPPQPAAPVLDVFGGGVNRVWGGAARGGVGHVDLGNLGHLQPLQQPDLGIQQWHQQMHQHDAGPAQHLLRQYP